MQRIAAGAGNFVKDIMGKAGCISILIVVVGVGWLMLGNDTFFGIARHLSRVVPIHVQGAPAIVTEIRAMRTLVTSEFSTQVVEMAESGWVPGFPERIILQAKGTILAGIDLSKITEGDIAVEGSSVTIRIPPAEIISQEVENVELFTVEGLLPGIDSRLQNQAQDAAHEELLHVACESGILRDAEEEAEEALTDLLNNLYFETVTVTTTSPSLAGDTGCP